MFRPVLFLLMATEYAKTCPRVQLEYKLFYNLCYSEHIIKLIKPDVSMRMILDYTCNNNNNNNNNNNVTSSTMYRRRRVQNTETHWCTDWNTTPVYCGNKEPASNRSCVWKSVRPFYTCLKVTAGKHCSAIVYTTVNCGAAHVLGKSLTRPFV